MILDLKSLFCEALAITATAVSTNTIDMGAPGKTGYGNVQLKRRLGLGNIPLLIQVVETFNNLGTLTVTLEQASDTAFTTPETVVEVPLALAKLKAGKILPIDKLPREITERYVRLKFTVAGGTAPTAGKITAGFVPAVDGAYMG